MVNADAILGADRVRPGDALIAIGSSGVHSNGYSLVRKVLADAGLALSDTPAELGGRTLGEELLTPTTVYARDCLQLIADGGPGRVHAFSHITGGGLAGNLARVLPAGLTARVDRATWSPLPVFQLLARAGGLARTDLELAFNLGVGMVAVVAAGYAEPALQLLAGQGMTAWRLGEVSRDETGGAVNPPRYGWAATTPPAISRRVIFDGRGIPVQGAGQRVLAGRAYPALLVLEVIVGVGIAIRS